MRLRNVRCTMTSRRRFLVVAGGLPVVLAFPTVGSASQTYACPPCGCASDGKAFFEPGPCPSCGMTLVAADSSAQGGALDIDALMKAHGIPGMSVAVIDDFKILWAKGYGVT